MRDTLMELLRDRVDEENDAREREVTVSHIQGVMASLGCDAARAMDIMRIDQSERDEYAELVGKLNATIRATDR